MATIFAQDDLSTTVTGSINGRVAALGGSWVSVSATSAGLGGTSGTINVVVDQGARPSTTTSPGVIAYLSNDAPQADYNIAFSAGNFGTSGAPGVAFRVNGTSAYFLGIATTYVVLYKTVNGSRTTLNQVTGLTPLSPTSTMHDFELQVSGNKFTLFRAGAKIWEYEDTTDPLTAPGKVGLFIRGDGRTTNFSAYTVDGVIAAGAPESVNTSTAAFVGGWTKAGTISAAGLTPTAQMQSMTYRVGAMSGATGSSTAAFDALPLITAQMYSLSQPDEPDFHSVEFEAVAGDIEADGTSTAAFVGRSIVAGSFASAGASEAALTARVFAQGEAEFSGGAGGSTGAFVGQYIISTRMTSSPSYDSASFRLSGVSFVSTVISAGGTSFADMTGIVSVLMAAGGSSTASFAPFDVIVPAAMSAAGSSIGALKELSFATATIRVAAGLSDARMTGVTIATTSIGAAGLSSLTKWAGATIYTSLLASEGVMAGRMVSLSFSSNIATPDDRVAALPVEDRLVTLTAEEREVLLPSEDREVLLPAEDRIAYL